MKTVLVFKTSVETAAHISRLQPALDTLLKPEEKWNFDLEDCDRILRVEAFAVQAAAVIEKLHREGFVCAELED